MNRFEKTNKHKRALLVLIGLFSFSYYLAGVPAHIVNYGMRNHIPAFDNGAPFHEVYSVFFITWAGGHMLGFILIFTLYMLCYGCWKQDS